MGRVGLIQKKKSPKLISTALYSILGEVKYLLLESTQYNFLMGYFCNP